MAALRDLPPYMSFLCGTASVRLVSLWPPRHHQHRKWAEKHPMLDVFALLAAIAAFAAATAYAFLCERLW